MSDRAEKQFSDQIVSGLMRQRGQFIREQKIAGWHRRRHGRRVPLALCPECKIALGEAEGGDNEAEGILSAMDRARAVPPVYARLRNGVA
jgi:hypothetical protein